MVKTLVLAVIVGTLTGSVAATLVVAAIDPGTRGSVLANALWLSSFGLLLALPLAFIYGLPVYLLLRRLRLANAFSAVCTGALPGLVWLLDEQTRFAGAAVTVGVCVGLAFYVLASHAVKVE